MNQAHLTNLLQQFKNNELPLNEVLEALKTLPFEDINHTKLDFHRELRNGYPEVVFGENKTIEQLIDIVAKMEEHQVNLLATRISAEKGSALKSQFPKSEYHSLSKCFTYKFSLSKPLNENEILIVTAGTSDLAVAEEAHITAQMLGHAANIISDVGVAGIHRLFAQLDRIRKAKVIIVVAGMEGALASVMGGLVDVPLIAVPTSVGYGANFNGVSALLGMLTSCANGITVVNIDNGYGAAYAACKILDLDKVK
ncbi:nickel pincer cofactor biosynthesis protein LarB [Saccharicrinis aurantiacus]|uniref:nickel pincer cofactor biosynthesis protein LarB n=1 Tax=Saccharicrinis aurantiacus TaxID=1849719 RepID=UPI0009502FCF|nr:nickel pincer cofactor biosynthesis protein LarB [Saccharicrinis aurantiacus]